jgi:hypothetical protein
MAIHCGDFQRSEPFVVNTAVLFLRGWIRFHNRPHAPKGAHMRRNMDGILILQCT